MSALAPYDVPKDFRARNLSTTATAMVYACGLCLGFQGKEALFAANVGCGKGGRDSSTPGGRPPCR